MLNSFCLTASKQAKNGIWTNFTVAATSLQEFLKYLEFTSEFQKLFFVLLEY